MLRVPVPFCLLSMLVPSIVAASDGVLEINQTCAVATGCFPGDAPGFPVTLDGDAGRSYRLTSDLNVGDPNTDGLRLTNSRLTIDFNGFSLVVFPLGSGSGRGVSGDGTSGSFAAFATLENGTIRGARSSGIALQGARGVRVQNMILDLNSGSGIGLGDEAQVVANRIRSSSGSGIQVGDSSIVSENVVHGSGGFGIVAGIGSTVRANTVAASGSSGISAGNGSTLAHNSAHSNGGNGIITASACTVIDNTSFDNGENGIIANSGSTAQRNTLSGNDDLGLVMGFPGGAYRGNNFYNNTGGSVSGGLNMGGNACNGVVCP